ncbi:hypothetical protein [Hydrogenovibrio marinus]|uniref:Uncharacterized protein n=1 Tax=Hydrogenovibrio marinus TaxID=28885 RepID=A0A066ZWZ8_HYDMR|nr:hypothetical protein [Hydrogenovibrio marinus]KDN94620.1 hypothetical protein EI16_12000 [Hydrogenovibrio marinus]
MTPSFTSKNAFKDLTWAIKEALPKSVQIKTIREAVAKFEGYGSADLYMDALDLQQTPDGCPEEDKKTGVELANRLYEDIFKNNPKKSLVRFFSFHEHKGTKQYRLNLHFSDIDENTGKEANYHYTYDEIEIVTFCSAVLTVRTLNQKFGFKSYEQIVEKENLNKNRYSQKAMFLGYPSKEDIKAMTAINPFVEPRLLDLLYNQDGSGSVAMRSLILNLYNGQTHSLEMTDITANLDSENFEIAIRIIRHYKSYGESCREFMSVAEKLARNKKVDEAYEAGFQYADKIIFRRWSEPDMGLTERNEWFKTFKKNVDDIAKEQGVNVTDKELRAEFIKGVESIMEMDQQDGE